MRDPKKLKVFAMAHELVAPVYLLTAAFPKEERYGLQSQIRRAVVSVSTNIVEGSSRRSDKEYVHFLRIAYGSASEAHYLIGLACELAFLSVDSPEVMVILQRYDELVRALAGLVRAIECDTSLANS